MASSSKEELGHNSLTCGICFEYFSEPKTLPCRHSFCKACLSKHIQASKENSSFACPTCNAKTELSAAGINGFRSNFFIQNLLKFEMGWHGEFPPPTSHSVVIKECDLCKKDNTTRVAIASCAECSDLLCRPCFDFHQRMKITQSHDVTIFSTSADDQVSGDNEKEFSVKGSAVDKTPIPPLSSKHLVVQAELCKVHFSQAIVSACMDCREMFCVLCLQDLVPQNGYKHKGHTFTNLEAAAVETRREFEDTLECVRCAATEMDDILGKMIDYDTEVEETESRLTKELKRNVDKLCQLIEQRRAELEKEAKQIIEKEKSRMQTLKLAARQNVASLTQQMDRCRIDSESCQVFEEWQTIDQLRKEVFVSNVEFNKMRVSLVKDVDLSIPAKLAETKVVLGTLVGSIESEQVQLAELMDSSLSLHGVGNGPALKQIKCEILLHRRYHQSISGLAVGPNGEFALADPGRKQVAIMDSSFKLIRIIKDNISDPYGIDVASDGKIFLAGVYINVYTQDGELLLKDVGKSFLVKATSVAFCQSRDIIVADTEAAKVYVLNNQGAFKLCLFKARMKPEFQSPRFVACGLHDDIVVCDTDRHCVKVFAKSGLFKFIYGRYGRGRQQMIRPEGICVDETGRIFVMDVGNNRIHALSPGGDLLCHIYFKDLGKFAPPPNMIAAYKPDSLLLGNTIGWVKVVKYHLEI